MVPPQFLPLFSLTERVRDKETVSESDETLPKRTQDSKPWTADRVRRLRMVRGQSQEAFAADVGVARPTVSAWEQGRGEISNLSVARLDELERGTVRVEPQSPAVFREERPDTYSLGIAAGQARAVQEFLEHAMRQNSQVIAILDAVAGGSYADRAKVIGAVQRSAERLAEESKRRGASGDEEPPRNAASQ